MKAVVLFKNHRQQSQGWPRCRSRHAPGSLITANKDRGSNWTESSRAQSREKGGLATKSKGNGSGRSGKLSQSHSWVPFPLPLALIILLGLFWPAQVLCSPLPTWGIRKSWTFWLLGTKSQQLSWEQSADLREQWFLTPLLPCNFWAPFPGVKAG